MIETKEWDDFSEVDIGRTARTKIDQLQLLDVELEKKKQKQVRSKAEDLFAFQCRAQKLPPYVREARFAQVVKRQWRFDFCFHLLPGALTPREIKLAVEIEGIVMRRINGVWQMGGRHASVEGFKEDCVKYSAAVLLGWHVLRFEQSQVKKGFAINMTKRVLHRMGYRAPQ